jgi:hypothetical protein
MRKISRWAWFLALVVGATGFASCSAVANDVAFGGAGADLAPLTENRVQMVSEDIVIERLAPGGYRILGEGDWQVSATYRFRNLTTDPVHVQMGFPEPACPADRDCDFTGFVAMTTTVRSEQVKLTVSEVDRRYPWAEHIGRVHLFAVTFTPNATVEVTHTYRHGLSEHINGGENLNYLTRTGALWAGTIEDARFRIRLPFRPWGLSFGEWGPQLVSFTEQWVDEHSQTELSFRWTNWEPTNDLNFYIGPGLPTLETPSLIEGCPAHGELFDLDFDADALDIAALRERTRTLSKMKFRICRNAIFAHHGKEFEDPELNRFFYGERGLQIHTSSNASSRGGAVFAKSKSFSPKMLTPSELAYIKAMQRVEQER